MAAAVDIDFPVNDDLILIFHSANEMSSIVFGEIIDIKIIYVEGKGCLVGLVLIDFWGIFHRSVYIGGKFPYELFKQNDAVLFEAVYSTAYFEIFVFIGFDMEIVFVLGFLLYQRLVELEIMVIRHGVTKVKILYVNT